MSKRTTANFYNNFSFFYPLVDVFLRPQKQVLFKEVNKLPAGKLLEIGIGNGAHLSQYKKHEVVGIDTSAAMLKIARKNNPDNAELIEMDGQALLFNDQVFDHIILSHVIAVVDDAEQLLQEVHRVLKPHGQVFILNHFTPGNWLERVDSGIARIAKWFHFRSEFRMQDLDTIQRFTLKREMNIGMASYFKLLIYQKP